ncbi:MAG: tRNA pseudouridine(55) synthase TruB [Deltaproteobacteria bacterium]|nr:tRNA pseudouridine(55) synthase TruB [Deltaproteobacteria bacterium]
MNGIVVIDKPSGKTSHDVVKEVKKILEIKKAGHTGTLDPLATGVLPVCINEGTKLAQFFATGTKDYRATMLLGVTTDTLDSDGKIVTQRQINVDQAEIEEEVTKWIGTIKQTPPRYSALKFKGKPLYKWARQGVNIAAKPRHVEILSITIEDIKLPFVTFNVSCSKGTYIRSLCSDIGESLGCGACLTGLRRTRNGEFYDQSAIALEVIAQEEKKHALVRCIIPLVDTLMDFTSIAIDETLANKIKSGHQPTAENMNTHQFPFLDAGAMVKFATNNSLIAIGKVLYSHDEINTLRNTQPAVKIMRVFNH